MDTLEITDSLESSSIPDSIADYEDLLNGNGALGSDEFFNLGTNIEIVDENSIEFIDPANVTLGDSEEPSTEEDVAMPVDVGGGPKFRVASRYSTSTVLARNYVLLQNGLTCIERDLPAFANMSHDCLILRNDRLMKKRNLQHSFF